jgi:gamma-glutamylcyclotransferase
MAERCPASKPMFTTTLPNYKLIFVGWARQWRGGTATIKFERGAKVLGAIYEVTDKDLRRLDNYEGYPSSYDRIKITVFNAAGKAIEALTYIKAGQLEETQPSKDYLSIVQQGYRDWRIV